MQVIIDWPHRDHFPVRLLQRGERGRVILMRGFGNNVRLLHLVRTTDQVICFTVGDYREQAYQSMRRLLDAFGLSPSQLSVLCNYPEQVEIAKAAGLPAHFCNTNAFIDEEGFRYQPMQKRFAAVSNARLVKLKRVRLAALVDNLAIIRGHELETGDYDDPAEIPHSYINHSQLRPRQVARVLQASRVGLALSAAEGNCAASGEYLLCGLPVVSTPSRGGRDIWYGPENSIICEPSPGAVRDAVLLAHRRLDRGEFDPVAIRQRHLDQSREHRTRFAELLAMACARVRAHADAQALFETTLRSLGIPPRYVAYTTLARQLS